jgi:hypothetical protein
MLCFLSCTCVAFRLTPSSRSSLAPGRRRAVTTRLTVEGWQGGLRCLASAPLIRSGAAADRLT